MSTQPLNPANYWEISYATTRILAETPDPNQAAGRILELVGHRLGWDLGAFWVVDELALLVRCIYFWNPRSGSEHFEQVSYARSFSLGEGLPGSTWRSREAEWISDVRQHPNFPRASVARLDGICSALSFPLYTGNRVLGVIEFFSNQLRTPDPTIFDFCNALGDQIGIFLDRAHATNNLKQVEEQFRMVAEKSYEAVFTIDEESNILYTNSTVERVFGYRPEELLGQKLMLVMPDYLRAVHEAGLGRYVSTGTKHISWDGVNLPGLHKDGSEVPLEISFGEFRRNGKRVFTGFVRDLRTNEEQQHRPAV